MKFMRAKTDRDVIFILNDTLTRLEDYIRKQSEKERQNAKNADALHIEIETLKKSIEEIQKEITAE